MGMVLITLRDPKGPFSLQHSPSEISLSSRSPTITQRSQQKGHVDHASYFNFSSSHIKKKRKSLK